MDFKKALGSHWSRSSIDISQPLLSKSASKKADGGVTRVGQSPADMQDLVRCV